MAKKYKIQVIAHQLKGKVVAKFGDVVDESQLTKDAKSLVKAGFIKSVSKKEQDAADAKADADAKAKADAKTPEEIAAEKLAAKKK